MISKSNSEVDKDRAIALLTVRTTSNFPENSHLDICSRYQ